MQLRFMMEDSIMVKDKVCTAGSSILYNFKAPFSATAYEKCIAGGMDFTGLVVTDELGLDGLFDRSDETSSSIKCLLENKCDIVLCNDVFGKLRRQAPQNGLIYIQPAYGTVSRYGLVPAVSSMDQIGVLCKNINEGMYSLSVISGHDEKDGTSLPQANYSYGSENKKETPMKVGISNKILKVNDSSEGVNVEFKYFDVMAQVSYILSSAEICNNTNRYDGVKFGLRSEDTSGINDLYIKTRTAGFKKDLHLASIVGCMVLSQEYYDDLYDKSMRIRRLIKDYYTELFSEVDMIALPVKLNMKSVNGMDKYRQSALYALSLLGGFVAASLPVNGHGVQLVTLHGREATMFSFMAKAQEVFK